MSKAPSDPTPDPLLLFSPSLLFQPHWPHCHFWNALSTLRAFALTVPSARNAVPYVSDLREMLGSEKTLHNNAENMPFVVCNVLSAPLPPPFHSNPIKWVLAYM